MLLFLYHYVFSKRDSWKDDGHEKNINCASDRANLILEPTRKAYTERNWDVFSRESARELSPEYREFWRTPQETHGKEIRRRKETNAMTTAGTNSPRCRVRHCRLMIKKK